MYTTTNSYASFTMSKKKWAAVFILATFMVENEEEKPEEIIIRKRRIWRKNWVRLRETEGFCAKLLLELRDDEPRLYQNFVRMTAEQFDNLLHLVQPYIKKANTNMRLSIPASERLVLTLRYLATGDSFKSLQYIFRIPQPTISTIIPEVVDAIYKALARDYLKVPKTQAEWEAVAPQFNEQWQFPNCIGALDGKHIVMVAPPNAGSVFYNYKGTHSIVLMGIADAYYKLIYVDVGRNGRYSDGGVFNRCTFSQALATNQLCLPPPKLLPGRELPVPYVIIMKPYAQCVLMLLQRVFNYRLSRARRIIENTFGIMSAHFRVLRKPMHLDAEKTKKITLACCVLCNYLLTTNTTKYAPGTSFDQYDAEGNLISQGDWRRDNMPTTTLYPLEAQKRCPDI